MWGFLQYELSTILSLDSWNTNPSHHTQSKLFHWSHNPTHQWITITTIPADRAVGVKCGNLQLWIKITVPHIPNNIFQSRQNRVFRAGSGCEVGGFPPIRSKPARILDLNHWNPCSNLSQSQSQLLHWSHNHNFSSRQEQGRAVGVNSLQSNPSSFPPFFTLTENVVFAFHHSDNESESGNESVCLLGWGLNPV